MINECSQQYRHNIVHQTGRQRQSRKKIRIQSQFVNHKAGKTQINRPQHDSGEITAYPVRNTFTAKKKQAAQSQNHNVTQQRIDYQFPIIS